MKKIVFAVLTLSFMLTCIVTVNADTGPKDSLIVYVENAPDELYYLDLLTQEADSFSNIADINDYNQDMLDLLYSYEDDGWFPAFTEGTGVPITGSLIGSASGSLMVHEFGYIGVPETYRIIIVTESGVVTVSDTLTRKALQSSVTYDYDTGKAQVPSTIITYLLQFAVTFSLTLILEGIILILFNISLKENWKPFLLVNLATQILLTVTVGIILIKQGIFTAVFFQIPAELIIMVIEVIVYRHFLTGPISNRKKIAYGIVANTASWILGFFLLQYLFTILIKLL